MREVGVGEGVVVGRPVAAGTGSLFSLGLRAGSALLDLIDLGGVTVGPARDVAQRRAVLGLRAEAYGPRYFPGAEEATDPLDDGPNATLLLAYGTDGRPCGTLRLLDRTTGALEVDQFVELDRLLAPSADPRSSAEASRLAVPRGPGSMTIKLALWKAFFNYCLERTRSNMLVWGRPAAARQYRRLLFSDLGAAGAFRHPRLGTENRTLLMDMRVARDRLRSAEHPLYEFFFELDHAGIRYR